MTSPSILWEITTHRRVPIRNRTNMFQKLCPHLIVCQAPDAVMNGSLYLRCVSPARMFRGPVDSPHSFAV